MTFSAFWVYYYTILVDNLWHKLCNFLSKYLVSIYFSQSTFNININEFSWADLRF